MSRRGWALGLGIGTGLWVVAMGPVLAFCGLSVMLSDAGTNWAVETAIYLAWAWPLVIVAGVAAAWIAFALKRSRTAAWLMAAPLAWLVVILVGWVLLQPYAGGPRRAAQLSTKAAIVGATSGASGRAGSA